MATPRKQPAKVYQHVVMARHPMSGKDMPVTEPYDTEDEAYREAAKRNQTKSHLQHTVKKIVKGTSGNRT